MEARKGGRGIKSNERVKDRKANGRNEKDRQIERQTCTKRLGRKR